MSVHSRSLMKYQDGMELRDRKMKKDCTQPLRIGNIRALNICAGRLFGAATLHNHKNSANKSNRKAMKRNWSNQKSNEVWISNDFLKFIYQISIKFWIFKYLVA